MGRNEQKIYFWLIIRKNLFIKLPKVGTNYFRGSEFLCHERYLNECQKVIGWGYCRAGCSIGKGLNQTF